MSSDLIGRRRASEQRLDRARSLELVLKEKTEILAESTGMSIEQLDFDGSFRAALTALAAVASRRTHFDVIVTLPDAPFAMRIQHVNNAVSAEVLIQRDGPFESVPNVPTLNNSASSPGYSATLPETPAYSEASGGYADAARLSPGAYADSLGSYSDSSGRYSDSSVSYSDAPGSYAESSGQHAESLGSVASISAREPAAMVQVASDLAELLWQGLDDMPS
ncbi:MAG TPA: hypothetical protein VLL08_19890 [Kineosporiaceae bacterium]|nr:hypothetical protein [Kineosporiaceae bacterium]